jgi:hypothetical protein
MVGGPSAHSGVARLVPAPRRGELVRLFGEELRAVREPLGQPGHGRGGQDPRRRRGRGAGDDRHLRLRGRASRASSTASPSPPSARPPDDGDLASAGPGRGHQRFNFPVAVWAWNAALAWVCGNPVVWKPSEKTPAHRARVPAPLQARRREGAREGHGGSRGLSGWCWARAPRASGWWTTIASASSPRPAPRPWAARSRRAPPGASCARCWSSAATTR